MDHLSQLVSGSVPQTLQKTIWQDGVPHLKDQLAAFTPPTHRDDDDGGGRAARRHARVPGGTRGRAAAAPRVPGGRRSGGAAAHLPAGHRRLPLRRRGLAAERVAIVCSAASTTRGRAHALVMHRRCCSRATSCRCASCPRRAWTRSARSCRAKARCWPCSPRARFGFAPAYRPLLRAMRPSQPGRCSPGRGRVRHHRADREVQRRRALRGHHGGGAPAVPPPAREPRAAGRRPRVQG